METKNMTKLHTNPPPPEGSTWESLTAFLGWNRTRLLSDTEIAEGLGPVSHVFVIGEEVWVNRNNGSCEDEYVDNEQLRLSILERACQVIFKRPAHMKNGVTFTKRPSHFRQD